MKRNQMLTVVAVLAFFLAGCAAPQVITSSPRVVTIENSRSNNAQESQNLADAHCRKSGRYAIHRPDNIRDGVATYECVE